MAPDALAADMAARQRQRDVRTYELPAEWGRAPGSLTAEQAFNAVCQPDLVTRYSTGDCFPLAYAVARANGWGVVVVGHQRDRDVDGFADDLLLVHAWARRPDGRLVDIRGVHEPDVAARLADDWGTELATYDTATEADDMWDRHMWATDEELADTDTVAGYVARFGAELAPEPDG